MRGAYQRQALGAVGGDIDCVAGAFERFETEMRNSLWRQPEWYRHAAGFARGKPLVVAENPYGGVVPEMARALKRGRAYDRFRQSLYEAAALGVNMSVPYGAWMGSVVEDAFYPPHDLATEIQRFIADHEDRRQRPLSLRSIESLARLNCLSLVVGGKAESLRPPHRIGPVPLVDKCYFLRQQRDLTKSPFQRANWEP